MGSVTNEKSTGIQDRFRIPALRGHRLLHEPQETGQQIVGLGKVEEEVQDDQDKTEAKIPEIPAVQGVEHRPQCQHRTQDAGHRWHIGDGVDHIQAVGMEQPSEYHPKIHIPGQHITVLLVTGVRCRLEAKREIKETRK